MGNSLNGIIGDVVSTELPIMADSQQEEALVELKKKAKYSRSKEFAELRAHMENRIKFYQSFLPGGVPIVNIEEAERGKYWAVADLVIAELQQVIDGYQNAEELAKEATQDNG